MLKGPKEKPYETVLRDAKLTSLKQRRMEQSLAILYRASRGLGPEYIREMVEIRGNAHNLRREMIVTLPAPKRELGRKSFIYEAGRIWNNMPNDVRLSPSYAKFREKLGLLNLGG